MGWLDFLFKKSSSSQDSQEEVTVKKEYVGNNLKLTFNTKRGEATVNVSSVKGPNGQKGVMYDCFLIAAKRWMQQGMEEDDFISEMKKVIKDVADGLSSNQIMCSLLQKHIAEKGRLVDTDLCTYISELHLAQTAVNGTCDRNELLDQMMQVAEKNFSSNLFITMYRQSPMGLQPYLVSFNNFVKNNR
ncbi:MAG: hypothetical protein KBF13_05370 [Prevotella sp.]|nr:hypothetical protein [Prevotella sp.]